MPAIIGQAARRVNEIGAPREDDAPMKPAAKAI
jgi:hypothetical protein